MPRTLLYSLAFSALALLAPTTAMAETITITDPTGVSGTFEITDEMNSVIIGEYVSDAGTYDYVYQVFSVSTTGAYSFGVTASDDEDVLLFLYDGGFDPQNPITNFLAGNDDTDGPENVSVNPAYTEACSGVGSGSYYCPSLEDIALE